MDIQRVINNLACMKMEITNDTKKDEQPRIDTIDAAIEALKKSKKQAGFR